MAKRRILILGAGLAGLSAAWHLQRKGQEPIVFEKEPEVGGLCRSRKVGGFTFDYCGHLLHFKQRYCASLIRQLLGSNVYLHKKSAWIYSHQRYLAYPFQANLFGLPRHVARECLAGFVYSRNNGWLTATQQSNSFSEWIKRCLGQGIAHHFMVPYNRKFWTVSCDELTTEWLGAVMPVLSLEEILRGASGQRPRREPFGYNARFCYPKRGGIASLVSALQSRLAHVYTQCQIRDINLSKSEIIFTSGNKERFDYAISTIPLAELASIIAPLPKDISRALKQLRWNSIFNLNIGFKAAARLKKHWIYFPEKQFSFYRLGFFHSFSPNSAPKGASSMYVEVSYSKEKPLDKKNIASRILSELRLLGLINSPRDICAQEVNDITYGYPIYDHNYQAARAKVLSFLKAHKILACGRYGAWQYLSMEGSLLSGKDAAEQLV